MAAASTKVKEIGVSIMVTQHTNDYSFLAEDH